MMFEGRFVARDGIFSSPVGCAAISAAAKGDNSTFTCEHNIFQ